MDARQHRFETLTRALLPDLYRYAFWLCRQRALAEDVVQEALLRAWKSLDSLRDESAAKQWLLTIVRREFVREISRQRSGHMDIDDVGPSEELSVSDEHARDVAELRRAMYQLDDDYREPLVLQVTMGYSVDEIARHMNLTTGAVLTRLHRARHKLQAIVQGPPTGRDVNAS